MADKMTGSVGSESYRKKYRVMKRKLRLLVYEQEAFYEELKKSQRKLIKVTRDKSFLLDRLVQYEQQSANAAVAHDSTSDSESTASSESGDKKEIILNKKRKVAVGTVLSMSSAGVTSVPGKSSSSSLISPPSRKRPPTAVKVKTGSGKKAGNSLMVGGGGDRLRVKDGDFNVSSGGVIGGVKMEGMGSLTREEVERRLEMRQINRPAFMSLGATPHSLPDDIFSNDSSNPLDAGTSAASLGVPDPFMACKMEDDDDANLVIDMAN